MSSQRSESPILDRVAAFEAAEIAEARGALGDAELLERLAREIGERIAASENWQAYGRLVAAYLRRMALRVRNSA